ncbi:MAG TPA: ABC transporter permease [Spirochaetia bacterium]|nr:ABC transporter permease [Spirochaetia bacterium]
MNRTKFALVVLIILYVFLLGPFLVIFVASFGQQAVMTFPPHGFSLKWFDKVFHQQMFLDSFWTSLYVALLATASALLLGVPAAYAFVRYNFRGKNLLETIISSPVIVPGLVIGFALLRFFVLIGNLPVLFGLYLGHTAILIPYALRVVAASLRNFDVDVEEAAVSLGAPRLRSFFLVVLPNIRAGVAAAFILSFITSFNNVPVSLFLTGPGVATLPIQMLVYMEYYFDPTIAALSSILIVVTVLIVQAAERAMGLSRYV